ncbi:MAG TPA: alpha/beta fold hydrolase [Rudaea sp.]
MSDHVILLHGLWMRAFTLVALRRRLEQAGFSVEHFDYESVFRGADVSVAHLLQRVREAKARAGRIHLVGHSLGGLIALQALQREPGLASGRVVCLGSPLRGSAVARSIAGLPGGAIVIGKNLEMLRDGLPRWAGTQSAGSIAGRLPIGLGFAIGNLASPHDGTVAVEETQLTGIADHCVVPASHTGLLFSAEAAEQTIAFLRHARFNGAH